jgi:ATP-dependent exoDNAse (exonuclease V) alpha subunit
MILSNQLKRIHRLPIYRSRQITPATIYTGFLAVTFSNQCRPHTSTRCLSYRQLSLPTKSLYTDQHNYTDEPQYTLSDEQLEALRLVSQGKNVFITGRAGTGKSVLIREIIRQAVERRKRVSVTSPTGSAALLVGGMTIHSWAGIGAGDKCMDYYGQKLSKFCNPEWRTTDLLVIDEISMVLSKRLCTLRCTRLLIGL